eukprot:scaffold95673_cov49-Phaeocystis_antarctica.AAC.1
MDSESELAGADVEEEEVEVVELHEEEGDATTVIEQTDPAEAAVRQAEAEGLTVQLSDNNTTGYLCVSKVCSKALGKPFCAQVYRAGERVHVGAFATAEEAALAYARTPEAQAQVANLKAPKPAPATLTAEEAVAQAGAEGLRLEPSNRTAGYRGVTVRGDVCIAR